MGIESKGLKNSFCIAIRLILLHKCVKTRAVPDPAPLLYKGYKDKGYTKMIHNGGTVKWKVQIDYHGCSVAMITSQKSLNHAINSFRVVS